MGVDLLALDAWRRADVIGYEIKVSRSDLRRELLRPGKRVRALAHTTEFYFAIPAGLLTADELAFEEPDWKPEDFARVDCPGVPQFGPPRHRYRDEPRRYGGQCVRRRGVRSNQVRVPLADVIVAPDWMQPREGETEESFKACVLDHYGHRYREDYAPCWTCGGAGYLKKSRVELESPIVWVPRDVGLVTVSGRGCRIVKPSPKRKDPKPIAPTRQRLNDLVRWVSHRPDPRHQPEWRKPS